MSKEMFYWQIVFAFVVGAVSTIGFFMGFWSAEAAENADIFAVGWAIGALMLLMFRKLNQRNGR